MAALKRTCARPPTPQVTWVHQIHAAAGASGSTNHGDGVCHVVCAFCVVSDSWLVSCTCCMYILEVSQSGPPRLAPYQISKTIWLLLSLYLSILIVVDMLLELKRCELLPIGIVRVWFKFRQSSMQSRPCQQSILRQWSLCLWTSDVFSWQFQGRCWDTEAVGTVQAWMAHFVTPLKCTYNKYNWRVTSQKMRKKHKQHDKQHHHGVGAARPSSGMDLMNPCRLRGGRPCTCLFQGRRWSDLIDLIN